MANQLVSQFQNAVVSIYGSILPIAQNLFILLAAITVTVYLIWAILEKDDPIPLMVGLLKNLMQISFFWFVLLNAQVLTQAVLNSFTAAGQAAAAAAGAPTPALSPIGILQAGSQISDSLINNFQISGLFGSLAGGIVGSILGLLLFMAFFIIAAQMVVALVEAFIIMSGGVLLLGFLGSPWTARFGMSYFAALIGTGVKVFMIYIIVALGSGLIAGWQAAATLPGVTWSQATTILGVALLFSFIAWSIPNYAQALVSGAAGDGLRGAVSLAAGFSLIGGRAMGAGGGIFRGGARGSAAVGQGVALARDRYQAGQGMARAVGAGVGHTASSPFRAGLHNAASRHAIRHQSAADVIRAQRSS